MAAEVGAGEPGASRLVAEAMTRSLVAVRPEDDMERARRIADRTGVHHLLVMDSENLVGILCLCDLDEAPGGAAVSEWMSVPVLTIRPDATLADAADTMSECAVGCLPVVTGGLILGVLSQEELARAGVDCQVGCQCRGRHRHARA
jgi:CBS domain-containing protein